jgi:disulfide bond formation protein DsbB
MQISNDSGPGGPRGPEEQAEDTRTWSLVFGAWLIALASTLGALFFGEVMKLPPCSLCWYQRIFMFPLALVLPFALFPFDRNIVRAVIPLVGIGGLLALFQVLLVEGVIPERVSPCRQGVPCSETVIEFFGFVTIPLLALAAFVSIGALLGLALNRSSK